MAGAYLPPELSLRRTEVVQLLPYAKVVDLRSWTDSLPLGLSPGEHLRQLGARYPDAQSLALAFYSGWLYLDRLDRVQQGYVQRQSDLNLAEKEYDSYRQRVHQAIRGFNQPAQPRTLDVGPEVRPPQLVKDESGLQFFRKLPWPEQGWSLAQLDQLLEACRQDQDRLLQQRAKLQAAWDDYRVKQDLWAGWLSELHQRSVNFTGGQMLQTIPSGWTPPE